MRKQDFDYMVNRLKIQNKWFKLLLLALIVTNLLMCIILYINFNYEKMIIVPTSSPENAYWIKNNLMSHEYLELISRDLLSLSLNFSPETIKQQYQYFLRFASPNLRMHLAEYLKKAINNAVNHNLSQIFYIRNMKSILSSQAIYVIGNLHTYVNGIKTSEVEQIYKMKFHANSLSVQLTEYRLLDYKLDANEIKHIGI